MRGDHKNNCDIEEITMKFGLKRGVAAYQDDRKRGILLYMDSVPIYYNCD